MYTAGGFNLPAYLLRANSGMDFYEASLPDLQNALTRGLFTSVQLTQAYLARIDQVNGKLHAVQCINPRALDLAAQCDKERAADPTIGSKKPLFGIPIGVKDNIAALGMPVTAGSWALDKAVPKEAADVLQAVEAAGAIVLCKLALSEWADFRANATFPSGWSGIAGQIFAAYGESVTPGGSSGGSAVAASVGLCAATLGSETFGSIGYPSSMNNVCGIRPTVGLLSAKGVIPISSHYDSVGPICRTIKDAAILMDALTRDSKYSGSLDANALKGKRLGKIKQFDYYDGHGIKGVPAFVQNIFDEAIKAIEKLGAEVVEVDLPQWPELDSFDDKLNRILQQDFKAEVPLFLQGLESNPAGIHSLQDVVHFNLAHPEKEMPKTYEGQDTLEQSAIMEDRDQDPSYAANLARLREEARAILTEALTNNKCDALVLPGMSSVPSAKAAWPLVIVPMGFLPEDVATLRVVDKAGNPFAIETTDQYPGMPVGLTFAAEAFSEAKLISFAYAFEQATHHRLKRKALPQFVPSAQLPL